MVVIRGDHSKLLPQLAVKEALNAAIQLRCKITLLVCGEHIWARDIVNTITIVTISSIGLIFVFYGGGGLFVSTSADDGATWSSSTTLVLPSMFTSASPGHGIQVQ